MATNPARTDAPATGLFPGIIELSRANGVSECLAYCWDLESNYRDEKRFQVKHWRDKKNGQGYALTDERDIYDREKADREARERVEAAERETRAAQERAEQAERRAEAERREREEKARREREADEARAADREHRRKVNRAVVAVLCEWTDITKDQAESVVTLIAAGQLEAERREREEKARREREADEARAADREHRRKVNRAVVAVLCEWTDITKDQAESVVTLIAAGQLSNVTIRY